MIKLWLKENDIPELTSFAGNIDVDKLKPYIFIAQTGDVKSILGSFLYDKINTEYIAGTLENEYATIYNDFVVYMLVYFACSHYVAFENLSVNNNGVTTVEQAAGSREINSLSARYRALANNMVINLKDWLKVNPVAEYGNSCISSNTNIINWF